MRCVMTGLLMLAVVAAWADNAVVVLPLEGMIDEGLTVLTARAVREANQREARGLVVVVDTPGGLVDAALTIAQSLDDAPGITIAYVRGMGATSAGALISLACDHIVMESGTTIGAATPVQLSAQGPTATSEKEVSFMRARMRALAEKKGHNPDVAQAMVDKDIELWAMLRDGQYIVQATKLAASGNTQPTGQQRTDPRKQVLECVLDALDQPTGLPEPTPSETPPQPSPPEPPGGEGSWELILAQGKLLTWTPDEARKYGLIDYTAETIEQALGHYELGDADQLRVELTGPEKAFRFLTNPTVAGILLMLALGGLYFEIRTPGFGVPGTIALVAFALFFGAHAILGMAEWLELMLIVAGVLLLLAEIFVLPGFGIAGVAGIACLAAGLFLTLTNFVHPVIPQYSWEYQQLADALYSVIVAGVAFAVVVYGSWKILPHTPLPNMLALNMAQTAETGYTVQDAEEGARLIGRRGMAVTMLRPTGRARFEDTTMRVVSRSDYIPKDTPVEIVEVAGNRYVVDAVQDDKTDREA